MKIDVDHVAKLANLPLAKEEKEKFEKQLSEVLHYISKLSEVDTENIPVTNQVTGLDNVIREDKQTSSLSQNEALSETNSKYKGLFRVEGIFEDE